MDSFKKGYEKGLIKKAKKDLAQYILNKYFDENNEVNIENLRIELTELSEEKSN